MLMTRKEQVSSCSIENQGRLEKAFGKVKEQLKHFEHCGIMHEQASDNSVVCHQDHYVKQLHALDM